MLKSIEERMEDQLLEKENKRFVFEGVAHRVSDEPGGNSSLYSEDTFKRFVNKVATWNHDDEKNAEIWFQKENNRILKEALVETLAEAVRSIPNDQELGAYIREAYHKTDGKFI